VSAHCAVDDANSSAAKEYKRASKRANWSSVSCHLFIFIFNLQMIKGGYPFYKTSDTVGESVFTDADFAKWKKEQSARANAKKK
jgi:hypothetical protein